MYQYLDAVLKRLIREIYSRFQAFRVLPFDELNVMTSAKELYVDLGQVIISEFFLIAEYYYRRENREGKFTAKQLGEILRTPSPVMMYSYDSELIRKRDRLIEAMIATGNSVEEIDKAMRHLTQMVSWFAIDVADAATAQARKDIGIKLVRWVTQRDGKVCTNCRIRDGKVYHADAIPPKPHPNCRCEVEDAE